MIISTQIATIFVAIQIRRSASNFYLFIYLFIFFWYMKLLKLNSGVLLHATVCSCVPGLELEPSWIIPCDPPGISFFTVHYEALFPHRFLQSSTGEFPSIQREMSFS